jgi:hypothetical protein
VFGAARRVPYEPHPDRYARRLRAYRFSQAEAGKKRRIDPPSDSADRVERCLSVGLQLGKRVRQLGRSVWILVCAREFEDQRHQLVLDPVVEIALQALSVIHIVGGGRRSSGRRRSERLSSRFSLLGRRTDFNGRVSVFHGVPLALDTEILSVGGRPW